MQCTWDRLASGEGQWLQSRACSAANASHVKRHFGLVTLKVQRTEIVAETDRHNSCSDRLGDSDTFAVYSPAVTHSVHEHLVTLNFDVPYTT